MVEANHRQEVVHLGAGVLAVHREEAGVEEGSPSLVVEDPTNDRFRLRKSFLNQLFNFYKDDKKALNYLKTSSSIPFLEYQDFIHLIELNMWNALIFLIENEKIEIINFKYNFIS